jgi:hypothetical protein
MVEPGSVGSILLQAQRSRLRPMRAIDASILARKTVQVEFAKARAAERRAARKLDQVLNAGASASSTAEREVEGPRVGPLELMRVWSSAGMLTLRRDLDAQAEEKLRDQLEALLSGQLRPSVWRRTVFLINDARRAADRLEETHSREWRQTFNSPQG